MPLTVEAIYENGVLKPTVPLNLADHSEVKGIIQSDVGGTEATTLQDPLLGLMSDDAELIDEVVEEALVARETHPFRVNK